jgi:hypothetical protein
MRINPAIASSLFAVAALAAPVAAQEAGPFGLVWLASKEEIQALGVTLSPISSGDYGESFAATGLPKALSDIETAVLSFGYDDQLWRIAAISREFKSDPYGTQVRGRYDELAASLGKAYEALSTHHRRSSDSFYGDPENFSYAIMQNETFWFSTFASPLAYIELAIDAQSVRDTYWRIIYTHEDGSEAFEAAKGKSEQDAL